MSTDLTATKIDVPLFDLKHTFESAQPLKFHGNYDEALDSLIYASGKNMISVMHVGSNKNGSLMVIGEDIDFARADVTKRFRLSDNMRYIYKKINTDEFIKSSIRNYPGMRLTLNDPWETTVCYIISQFNNVKRIRMIIKNLIEKFGKDIYDKNGNIIGKSFPESHALMNASIKDLMKCGTGFRAKYIKSASEYCTNTLDLSRLNPNKYDTLKEELMEMEGVGDKVADCIILMGYGNLRAFPIDVWVKRTVEKIYFKGRNKKISYIHDFADETWGKYQGYAQQYLFHNARINRFSSQYIEYGKQAVHDMR
jgi:N-glycosylase/DNA lyase